MKKLLSNFHLELVRLSGKGIYSQLNEDVILMNIFDEIGHGDGVLLDIGAGDYDSSGMSNTRALIEEGWTGLLIDANERDGICKLFVTPGNIVPFLESHRFPKKFDLLSIDIDSFDLDVMESILSAGYSPRVICSEFNGTLNPYISVKLKYEDGYTWDGTNKYGYSFMAGLNFADKFGYTVVLNHKNMNLFMIKNEEVDNCFVRNKIFLYPEQQNYHATNEDAHWVSY